MCPSPCAGLKKAVLATAIVFITVGVARSDSGVYRKALGSTTWIVVPSKDGITYGTGWLADRDQRLVVTSEHVIREAREALVYFPQHEGKRPIVETQRYLCEYRAVVARVIATDPVRDLTVLRLDAVPDGVQALTLAATSSSPGDDIHSVGNSGIRSGLGTGSLWWYTRGSVRQVHRQLMRVPGGGARWVWLVETQAPVNEGDSGGAVVDHDGQVVGVAMSYTGDRRLVSQNVDVREVRAFLAEARDKLVRAGPAAPASSPMGTWLFRSEAEDGKVLSGEGEFHGDGTFVLSRPGAPLKGRYAYANGQFWLILEEGLAQGSLAWRGADCFRLQLGKAYLVFDRKPPAKVGAEKKEGAKIVHKH